MVNSNQRWIGFVFKMLAVLLALIFTTLILLVANGMPFQAYKNILIGSLGSTRSFSNVLVAWVPLLLTTAGVLITFTVGLWNIGVEGQITIGAIFTTGAFRLLQDSALPPELIIILGFLAGMLGGAIWALLAGALKTFGGVNEIFGGLGLNFVATSLTIWLIFGPWKRPGVGSMSGTEPFPESLWLPLIDGLRLSWWSLGIGIIAIVAVYFLLSNTYIGLKLRAIGKNKNAAALLGIPTSCYMMFSFALCGVFAGLAGAVQVTAVYHRLIPSISSSYGFLGLMVAMLVNYQAIFVMPVALFFAILNIGSIQLPIVLGLDSTVSGVLQGAMVLFVLIMEGVNKLFTRKSLVE